MHYKLDDLLAWIRKYANERINSQLFDERRCFPPYVVLDFGNQGLLGMYAPKQYGGLQLNNYSALKILQQLGGIDPSLGLFTGLNNILGIRPILKFASQSIKEELLPSLVPGRQLAAFALTEPGAGSNPLAIESYAKPVASNQWQLYGKKIWSGSAAWAGVINVFVKLYDEKQNEQGITAFVVKQGAHGLKQGPEALTMGMRGMVQNEFYLEGVIANKIDCLGELGAGMQVAQDAMMYGRLAIGAITLGGMKRCAQLMMRYAERRTIATGKLLDNSVVLFRFSEITAAITSLDVLIDTVSHYLDQNEQVPVEFFTVCKIIGSEYFWNAADHLVQCLGGRGYTENNIAPQLLRDARIFRVFEGPTETLYAYLGSRLINNPEIVNKFIIEKLKAPHIIKKIESIKEIINQHFNSNKIISFNQTTQLQWQTYVIGELGCYCLLLAVVESQHKKQPSQALMRAIHWIEQTINRLLKQRSETQTDFSSILINSVEAQEFIYSYETGIGDIEQSMAGENHTLDVMLTKEKAHSNFNIENELKSERVINNDKQTNSNENTKILELKKWIMTTIAQKLKLTNINDKQTFFELGLDSVTILQLVADLEDYIGFEFPTEVMWKYNNITKLAHYLHGLMCNDAEAVTEVSINDSTVSKLNNDILLLTKKPFNPEQLKYQHISNPGHLLLTGATGFLGAFLLKKLLETSNANVYCLVRGNDPIDALSRIKNNLLNYQLVINDSESVRIKPVCGDLTKENLGLSDDDFQFLANHIEVIYHNGALVNHLYDYESMRAANVLSTCELIKLAGLYKIKPIHFVSSLGVAIKTNGETFAKETFIDDPADLLIGYTQTKWVSEQLLLSANEAGIPITVFRCGMVAGHSKTGMAKLDDLFHSFIKLFIETKKAPVNTHQVIDVVPVDYVCDSIVHIANNSAAFGKVFHIANPKPIALNQFFNYLEEKGYLLEFVDNESWLNACLEQLKHLPDKNKSMVLAKYFDITTYGRGIDIYFNAYQFEQQNVQKMLAQTEIAFPKPYKKLLDTYFNFFEMTGFISKAEVIVCE